MIKNILFGLMFLFVFTEAKMVDAVALVVEGEAITTAEISAVAHQKKISGKKAVDLLILDRLQKVTLQNIDLPEDEVDNKIAQIAAQNDVSISTMQKILKQRGTSWTKYRSSIRNALKKEKFYNETVAGSIAQPGDDELKLFYKRNKKKFTLPSRIRMIEYSTEDEDAMKRFLRTKKRKGIRSRTVTKRTKGIDPSLLAMLLKTQNGAFTPPFNAGDRYVVFKVLSKKGRVQMPFEAAKPAVLAKWKEKQQQKALKEYFEKLKTNANIQKLR